MTPLAIDLFCGLGGWTEGLLEAGYRVIGFDIERHAYGSERYPAQLVIQDVLTIHGSQFRNADLIVASPPCQEYSYMAMPWSRAKQIAAALRGPLGARKSRFDPAAVPVARDEEFPKGYKGSRTIDELNALFNACFRIQREASAAGRHIPMVVENVRGAQPWVGKARANYGSFYLWGDVPALMPVPHGAIKAGGNWSGHGQLGYVAKSFHQLAAALEAQKTVAHVNRRHLTNQAEHDAVKGTELERRLLSRVASSTEGTKINISGHAWYKHGLGSCSSKSSARKAASARIAKIPIRLGRYLAQFYKPEPRERVA